MSVYSKKLHIRKDNKITDIDLFTEVQPTPSLKVKDGDKILYAKLGKASDSMATPLYIRHNNMVYSVLQHATKSDVIYAFMVDGTESDPSKMITYLEENKDYTPAKMDYDTGEFDYGSWKQDEFFMPRPCMLKYDGTVDYYLDPNNYGLRADNGEASDVANTSYEGNAMMEWGRDGKKIWYKIVPFGDDNTSAKVYISDYQVDTDYHAWSFINANGVMGDHFYTPIYDGTVINGKLRSLSNQIFRSDVPEKGIAYAEANNPDDRKMWYTEVYADVTLINLLLMLIGKSTDSQTTFGFGNSRNGAGYVLDPGKMDTKGLFWGTKTTSDEGVKVFGMEHWWGNATRCYAGHVSNSNYEQLVKLTYGTQDGSTTTGYNTTGNGYLVSTANLPVDGCVIQFKYDNKYGMLPYRASSSDNYSSFYCDYSYVGKNKYAARGGYPSSDIHSGMFRFYLMGTASDGFGGHSTSISCKPIQN